MRATSEQPQMKLQRWLRASAWASFILNIVIIATGGAVRLTGSGLGCSDWPLCTPGNLFPTAEQSFHALVEFGNRTVSGPLALAAAGTLLLTWWLYPKRRYLGALSSLVFIGVIVQAVIGGFVVWLDLDANLVAFHYVASLVLVCLTAAYLVHLYNVGGVLVWHVPRGFVAMSAGIAVVLSVSVIFGVMTTSVGPHSGDVDIVRTGFDATALSHVHAWPGYVLVALFLAGTIWSFVKDLDVFAGMAALLLLTAVQAGVGVFQARNGLPAIAVGAHMVLAAIIVALMTIVFMRSRKVRTLRQSGSKTLLSTKEMVCR